MAMAFSWDGHADTDVKFSSFFNADHTIGFKFMPQYPDSYINVIVGYRSTVVTSPGLPPPVLGDAGAAPFFAVGQGSFSAADQSPTLFLRVGTKEVVVNAPLKARTWHHLAVTRQGNKFTLYFDGQKIGTPVTEAVQATAGTALRFGSTAGWTHVGSGLPPQFYGLLDNVAVFNRVLSSKEIVQLSEPAGAVTGLEKGLVAGWIFLTKLPPPPSKLPPALKFTSGNAATKIVQASFNDDDSEADAALLLFPPPEHRVHLPCAKGQILWVAQDPSMVGESHVGTKNFIYDIKPVKLPAGVDLTLKVNKPPVLLDIPFQAPSKGKVLFADGTHPSGVVNGTNDMWTSTDGQVQLCWRFLHWTQNSAKVAVGDQVKAGTELAVIGNSGEGLDNTHLHYGLFWFAAGKQPPGAPGLLTIPFAYKDYFLLERTKKANGTFKDTWKPVDVGMPKRGDVVTWGRQP